MTEERKVVEEIFYNLIDGDDEEYIGNVTDKFLERLAERGYSIIFTGGSSK